MKSSAYLQSWTQSKLSRIVFDIAKKKAWFAATNKYSRQPIRASDVYVFCLLGEKDPQRCDPLEVSSWEFYAVRRKTTDTRFGEQKSVGLGAIRALENAVNHHQLKKRVNELADQLGGGPD